MIHFFEYRYNRLARMHRLFAAMTILQACLGSFSVAACDDEITNANNVAQRIADEWPLRPARDIETLYVQRIAVSLAHTIKARMHTRYFEWPAVSWRFLLVRDLSVNAYSIGNGRIYLTDGTFDFVKNEAELVAIIAHELAHQLLGHFCQYNEEHSEYRIGSLVQVMDNNKEMEADALAVEILQLANFPAWAMLDIVKRLPVTMQSSLHKRLRIQALEHQLRRVKRIPFSSSSEFLQIKKQSSPLTLFE